MTRKAIVINPLISSHPSDLPAKKQALKLELVHLYTHIRNQIREEQHANKRASNYTKKTRHNTSQLNF